MVMAVGRQSCRVPGHRKADPCFGGLAKGWRIVLASAFLSTSLIAGTPLEADEFDPLALYEEARVLNDHWQACAASFVRERLRSRSTAEQIAERALDRCRAPQGRLSRFLVARIGRTAAGNVMALLHEKYRSGLVAAITELRARR
jgi:hypothetical protein